MNSDDDGYDDDDDDDDNDESNDDENGADNYDDQRFQYGLNAITVKHVLKGNKNEDQKLVFQADYSLMQIKSIAECSKHSATLSTLIKLLFAIKTFVLSIFE